MLSPGSLLPNILCTSLLPTGTTNLIGMLRVEVLKLSLTLKSGVRHWYAQDWSHPLFSNFQVPLSFFNKRSGKRGDDHCRITTKCCRCRLILLIWYHVHASIERKYRGPKISGLNRGVIKKVDLAPCQLHVQRKLWLNFGTEYGTS